MQGLYGKVIYARPKDMSKPLSSYVVVGVGPTNLSLISGQGGLASGKVFFVPHETWDIVAFYEEDETIKQIIDTLNAVLQSPGLQFTVQGESDLRLAKETLEDLLKERADAKTIAASEAAREKAFESLDDKPADDVTVIVFGTNKNLVARIQATFPDYVNGLRGG